jgi:hypothetical protein
MTPGWEEEVAAVGQIVGGFTKPQAAAWAGEKGGAVGAAGGGVGRFVGEAEFAPREMVVGARA